MPKRPKQKTVTQSGTKITIDCEGYEFREEDIGWLNIHRGVLTRGEKKLVLTFPNENVAIAAFDEMVGMGAGNVDSQPDLLFTNDAIQRLAKSLSKP